MESLFAMLILMVVHLQKMIFSQKNVVVMIIVPAFSVFLEVFMILSYPHSAPKFIMAYANDAVFNDENLHAAANSNSQTKLKGKKYYVTEGKKRYLWLATRMGMLTVKDAPGIEIVQTYNLLTHDQIVGMVMKKLV